MKFRIKFLILFLFTFSISTFAQTNKLKRDWKQFEKCGFTFFALKTLESDNRPGTDSCVGTFTDSNLIIHIDLGWYSGKSEKDESTLNFKEQVLTIDGKKAQ